MKVNAMMLQVAEKAKQFEQFLGKTVQVQAIGADLRHLFTGAVFRKGGLVEHEFDGFLRGQLMAQRIVAFIEGKKIGSEPAEIKGQAEGSGVNQTGTPPLVENLNKPEVPVEPETPTEPETPAATVEDSAPAVKTSILKKTA